MIGASGTVAMQRLLNEEGADDLMMTMGLGVVGAVYTNESSARVTDATPARPAHRGAGGAARPGGLAVRDRRGPGRRVEGGPRRRSRVGGGSTAGGPDHLFPMQLAAAIGIDAARRQLHLLRRRRSADRRAARLEDRRRHQRAQRVRGPDRGRVAARARHLGRRSRSRRRRRPDADRSPASTWSSPTGAASSPRRASPTRRATELTELLDRDARARRPGRSSWRPTAGSTRSAPARSSTTFLERAGGPGRVDPEGAGAGMSTTQNHGHRA